MGFDKPHGTCRDRVSYVFVAPDGRPASLHITYAPDAIDDRVVMTVARLLFVSQSGIRTIVRLAVEGVSIAHLDRMLRVGICYHSVFDEDARHPVGRGRHDIRIVETKVGRRAVERCIPVLTPGLAPQPEMPLADDGSHIACRTHHVGQRICLG